MDSDVASNYTHLHTVSKMLDMLFMVRIRPRVESCRNFNHYQSAYRRGQLTETTLMRMLYGIYRAADNHSRSLLQQLDLSAASDTLDKPTLLRRLDHTFGVPYVVHPRGGSTPTSTNAVSIRQSRRSRYVICRLPLSASRQCARSPAFHHLHLANC